jgi:hypothetical protein
VFRIPEPLEPGAGNVVVDERVLDDLLDGIEVREKSPDSELH